MWPHELFKYLILGKLFGKFLIPMVNMLDVHPWFIFVNFSLSNVHMEIGELCKRNNRKKGGKLSCHHNMVHYFNTVSVLLS